MIVRMEEDKEVVIDTMPTVIEATVPQLSEIPENVLQILCLLACNFSIASVARLCKCSSSNIHQFITKYDPDREFRMSSGEKKKFLSKLFEARAGEALLYITPDKLEESSAVQLARLAQLATKAAQDLEVEEDTDDKNPYDILDRMGKVED